MKHATTIKNLIKMKTSAHGMQDSILYIYINQCVAVRQTGCALIQLLKSKMQIMHYLENKVKK